MLQSKQTTVTGTAVDSDSMVTSTAVDLDSIVTETAVQSMLTGNVNVI